MYMCLHVLMLTMPSQANDKHTDIYSAQDETFIFALNKCNLNEATVNNNIGNAGGT